MPISKTYNMDCMEYMKSISDKFFDLAIVDPPYGLDKKKHTRKREIKKSMLKQWKYSTVGYTSFKRIF